MFFHGIHWNLSGPHFEHGVLTCIFPEECGEGLPSAHGEFGEHKDEMPVGDGADHLLPYELGPEGVPIGGTRRAKTSLLTGKGDEIFIFAGGAPDAR